MDKISRADIHFIANYSNYEKTNSIVALLFKLKFISNVSIFIICSWAIGDIYDKKILT